MQRPRILIISLGSIGKRHLRNTRKLLPQAEIGVLKLHDLKPIKVPEGANHIFYNLNDAVAFLPQAVIVSSPAPNHLANTIAFARIGAAIFIEKPLYGNEDQSKEFFDLLHNTSSFLMVGYVLRFHPCLRFIRKMIQNGEVGDVRTATVEVGQYLPDWRPESDYRVGVSAQKKLGGGVLLELSHEIDYSLWLFGVPKTLYCLAGKISDLEIDVEDSANILFEYGNPLSKVVSIKLDFLQRAASMRLQIVGSSLTLEADLINEVVRTFDTTTPKGKIVEVPKMKEGNEIYLRQFDFFFSRAISGYKAIFPETSNFQDYVSVEHGIQVMKIVEVAKASNSTGEKQHLKSMDSNDD